ncbi:MAG: hypothetical protein UU73_C0001G0124 [Candidatus Daviesbacteria bacterium GW2011_GWA1_41_61]|uniref:Glycosyltransferase RgtA/B/C/D-like domain-containing protein n=1 Tax=Candidatus Daviesbacteria bacterium GW2011_GWA2_40_9 TaxID=1618424 RepID=A0A0G0U1M8_9BACT|nr:MAG: hypothetical protein UU29_C0008G0127 [Candidatus Daviesbacteria bacterium GW2011_GWA2_40_9]KKR92943.1 MAG: hypothetical protein UU44_C0004G0125 [Candidatus Daviesbacteria bacterium GW2011_GWB1_41_15]KKS15487.1 MAG: hypothetical protein UU73_C0001G0124 [Candidatus Daviesbacteria bacterium GW2011_GWA1_41_61]
MQNKKILLLLFIIFVLALTLRFLYFPNNIYFGFDQARDAFASLEIVFGEFRVVGPPTSVDGWFHGPLYYYLYAPLYYLGGGDPKFVAAFLRIINAGTIFLVFGVGTVIFNKRVGLLSALFFAFSFEQTQYALYFNHPSLAVVTVTIFYLGLALLFFKKEPRGLILALAGLGLSIQFEFVLTSLLIPLALLLLIFRKTLPKINKEVWLLSILAFALTTATFIAAEIKFHFRSVAVFSNLLSQSGTLEVSLKQILDNIYLISHRLVGDNLLSENSLTGVSLVLLIAISLVLLIKKSSRLKTLFLVVWFLSGTIPYYNNTTPTPLYYYSVGASISLLIGVSFLLTQVWERVNAAAILLIIIPLISNLMLITSINSKGSMSTINVQSGMLLSDEKKVLDYIYQASSGQQFTVYAVTMPFSINTTWSYLFQWYGKGKYGYLPIWGGEAASGYPGNLQVVTAKSTLPSNRFLIIEPTRGIRDSLIENILREESYFTKVSHQEKIGDFIVQKRYPI